MAVTLPPLSPKALGDLQAIAARVPKERVASAAVRDLDRVMQRLFESAGGASGVKPADMRSLLRELEGFLAPLWNYAASGKGADRIAPAQELAQVLGLQFPAGTQEGGMFAYAMAGMRNGIESAASAGLGSRWANRD